MWRIMRPSVGEGRIKSTSSFTVKTRDSGKQWQVVLSSPAVGHWGTWPPPGAGTCAPIWQFLFYISLVGSGVLVVKTSRPHIYPLVVYCFLPATTDCRCFCLLLFFLFSFNFVRCPCNVFDTTVSSQSVCCYLLTYLLSVNRFIHLVGS